jgi:hypothetical protein
MYRCPYFFAGVALAALASNAPAVTLYQDNLNPSAGSPTIGPEWDFSGVHFGTQLIESTNPTAASGLAPTNFLGEFGGAQTVDSAGHLQPATGDVVKLKLSLPQDTATVSVSFDLYLLRTWDGSTGSFGGPDVFGYGYTKGQTNTDVLSATFSNGAGEQSYCPGTQLTSCAPTFGSVAAAKNNLGFTVARDPQGPGPALGEPFSLLYQIPGMPIPYSGGGDITFYFFSRGLQVVPDDERPHVSSNAKVPAVADESWGISNIKVTYALAVPEPGTWSLMLGGLAMFAPSLRRRLAK